jgi:thiol-disulfide isomerase/thioredoxin
MKAMKHFITTLLLLLSITSYSQTQYYTTDGKNRMTESEVKSILSEKVSQMSKILGKQLYGSLTIESTETKKDSIISKVAFAISDKKEDNQTNSGPLSDYINKDFPKFNLKTLSGEDFSSEQLIGKPTLINFWFTSCAPCIDEIPILNRIAEKYRNDFNFISITFEDEQDVAKFIKKHPYDFKHLVDAGKFTKSAGIKSYPMNVFLDKNGVLKYVGGGIPYEGLEGGELIMGEGNEIIEIIEKLK